MTKDVLLDLIKRGFKSDMRSRKQAGARRANRKRLSVLMFPRSGPPLGLTLRRPSIWALMEFIRAGCFWSAWSSAKSTLRPNWQLYSPSRVSL
uniref:Uncharacterized protein n=1 Tax=Brassica oleracea var. oleracea TaxID=109376 RepID=A0A0D3DQV4_BRAOL